MMINKTVKRILADSVICMLLMINVILAVKISDSVKPRCIVDGCRGTRCEKTFYCSEHNHAFGMESVIHYGKR